MTPSLLFLYALATLLLALVAGVFLAFSDFVMRSLRLAAPGSGIEAMQVINREVYSSIFLVLLLGMAPASAALGAYAWVYLPGPSSVWFLAGAVIYGIGTFGVTMLGNVPMNQRLDKMPLGDPATAAYWQHYLSGWTRWNHLRTVASAISAACFLTGCVLVVS